jgi:hypothetical protein
LAVHTVIHHRHPEAVGSVARDRVNLLADWTPRDARRWQRHRHQGITLSFPQSGLAADPDAAVEVAMDARQR